jgi:hypothetical protein
MQLYVLLPLLLPVARLRPPFWAVLLAIVALTLAVYWGNRLVYRVPYTGSYVLWYTPVVLLGMWLAAQTARLDAVLRRGWLLALGCAGAGLWLYLPLALDALRGQAVNTFQYQVGNWLFTTGSVSCCWQWRIGSARASGGWFRASACWGATRCRFTCCTR